MDENVEDGPY